jgi:cell division protein FtsI/penicillin-binding protein 2
MQGGGYEPSAIVASFMGYAPAYKPRLVIAVVVTKPVGSHWGATVAAPVFSEIGEKALWYLRVPADKPEEPGKQQKQGGDIRRVA